MIIRSGKRLLYSWGIQRRLSARRLRLIDRELSGRLLGPHAQRAKILDVGCATGKDFVTLVKDREDMEIVGLDLRDCGLRQGNFRMIVGDAASIPFADSYFDVTVSIGVLEHIQPIEKLAKAIEEINRVSKSYAVVVPSANSVIEPHLAKVFWQLRDRARKSVCRGTLLYMSDEAWLAFNGFKDAKSRHFWHVPLLVGNLLIHKGPENGSDPMPAE